MAVFDAEAAGEADLVVLFDAEAAGEADLVVLFDDVAVLDEEFAEPGLPLGK